MAVARGPIRYRVRDGAKTCDFNRELPGVSIATMSDPSPADPPPRPATLREVVGVVFSSFLGIRKGQAMRRDAVAVRPQQVIVVGIALAAVFVLTLILLVRLIIRLAGA
jgi:hypothetical protein